MSLPPPARLLAAFFRAANSWGLTGEEQRRLLGSPARATWARWRDFGGTPSARAAQRISGVLRLQRDLEALLGSPAGAEAWLHLPNPHRLFRGRAPVGLLRSGRSRDLDALCRHAALRLRSQGELLRRARARAPAVREQLTEQAGGFLGAEAAAGRLGVLPQTLARRSREGELLALPGPDGLGYPACQFGSGGVVRGLPEVLAAMNGCSFWEILAGLVMPTPLLEGRSVLEALREAATGEERLRIVSVARAYAEE